MLVPVRGGIEKLQRRNRQFPMQQARLAMIPTRSIYIFNLGPRVWRGVGGGKEWVIPACPKGERYSDPIAVPELNISEVDLADGGNNLGVTYDSGRSGIVKIGKEEFTVSGVADDILGKNSTTPQLDINTTNGEWFGVFMSEHEQPLEREVEEAESKLREMMQLIYAQGAEKVQAGEKVLPNDRKRYNEAAELLHQKPLWGNLDHTMDACPLCGEDIRRGAMFCKHCHNKIDQTSVEAFFRQQEQEMRETLEAGQADGEAAPETTASEAPSGPRKKPRSRK